MSVLNPAESLERLARSPDEGRWVATVHDGGVRLETRDTLGGWHASPGRAPQTIPNSPRESLPAICTDHELIVLFDGLLFNLDDLLASARGARTGMNAVELIALLWREREEGAISLLKGLFALIVVEPNRQRTIAARDPLGVFPLFYARDSGALLFSTTAEALRLHPSVRAPLNRAALADHLRHQWPVRNETFFSGISRVLPGSYLVIEPGGTRSTRYWNPAPGGEIQWVTDDELPQFDGLLEQAVRRCLRFGSPGVFLSGGLDSITVTSVAAGLCADRGLAKPYGLSLAFPDPEANEEEVQRGIARQLGLKQSVVPLADAVTPYGLVGAAHAFARTWPAPLVNIWYPAYFQMTSRCLPPDYGAIFTGTGGDELYGVTPALAADLLGSAQFRAFARFVRVAHRSFHLSIPQTVRVMVWQEGLRALMAQKVRAALLARAPEIYARRWWRQVHALIPPWLAPDPDLRREMEERITGTMPVVGERSLYLRDSIRSLDHPLMSMEPEDHFESGRRLGRWVLHPLLDADLVHFVYRIPPAELYKTGRAKSLLRERLTKQFPELGFERQKKVDAQGTYRRVLLDEGGREWQRIGGATALARLGVVDPVGLNREISATLEGRQMASAFRIWDLLSTEGFTSGHEA